MPRAHLSWIWILILAVCIAVCIVFLASRKQEQFYDTPSTTTAPIPTTTPIPVPITSTTSNAAPIPSPTPTPIPTINISSAPTPANKNTTCSNSTDMISVCMNYESCCTGTGANPNSKCFCSHPFVSTCNDAYKSCLAGGGDASGCNEKLKGCCSKYSGIDILSTNFKKPINASQSSNAICTLNGLSDLEQRCMEVCQTNPACKAYGMTLGGCTLYDGINYVNGKSGDNYIYVAKK